jgi:hypothetical protein
MEVVKVTELVRLRTRGSTLAQRGESASCQPMLPAHPRINHDPRKGKHDELMDADRV